MIEAGSGDLLDANVDALVNPVNCVGVMGKGLALAFKQRFLDNFAAYKRACDACEVQVGRVFVFDRIINFPTKRHWRDRSRLEDIRDGLVDLIEQIRVREIGSVAIPALGCGLGGLAWADVRPLIATACAQLPAVRFVLFAPTAAS